jgi:anti-sigma factor RsiW
MSAWYRDHGQDGDREARLLRHLLGGGSPGERAELARRLVEEPELAREAAELERIWTAIELPPAAPAPPGFASRVSAKLRERDAPRFADRGLRWASAVALVAGIGAGAALSDGLAAELDEPAATLAESYLDAADEPGALSDDDSGVDEPMPAAPVGAESGL